MQSVADLARVHRTTVSLALRDHPRIPPATRDRVKAAAQKLGYQMHPLVAALMQAKRSMKPPRSLTGLAWLTMWPTRYGWRAPENPVPDFLPGAAARAEQLGFKLTPFWLGEPGMTPARMAHILYSRGISGVIVGRMPPGVREIDFPWERFAAVAIGVSLESPRLSHVAANHFHVGQLAIRTVIARGYRRVGFALPQRRIYQRVQGQYIGAYFAEHFLHPQAVQLPPLVTDEPDEPAFIRWVKRHRPDVVICPNVDMVRPWLEAAGWRVPRDIGLAGLAVEVEDGSQAGVWSDPAIIGAMASELVVSLLHRNERGVPAHDQEILYRPSWREGETLPQIAPAPRKK
jgi:LacI family transcriptional regulator